MSPVLATLMREALMLFVALSAPMLAAVFAVGLVSAVLQSATGVRERSLASVPRLLAGGAALVVTAPWIASRWIAFVHAVMAALPALGRG